MSNKIVMETMIEKIQDELSVIYDALAEIERITEVVPIVESNKNRPLDAVPHVLKSGPNKGKTALRWPSGAFVHNDWELNLESVKKTYSWYGIKEKDRVPF